MFSAVKVAILIINRQVFVFHVGDYIFSEVGVIAPPTSEYASLRTTKVDFPAWSSLGYFILSLTDDNIVEDDEVLQLYLTNPSQGHVGQAFVDVTIIDDDGMY